MTAHTPLHRYRGIPRFFWPVVSLSGGPHHPTPQTVATFFTERDASAFVHENLGERDLYIGGPHYDRRASGYRPVESPSGYQEWLASLEPKHIGSGRYQVAA